MKEDYEINEGVFTIYNTLIALKSHYYNILPKDVEDKTYEYLEYLRKNLEKDYIPNLDIIDGALIDRVVYDKGTIEK